MNKYSHMTFSDRLAIEQGLYDNESFNDISIRIGKDASTVAKEVKRVVLVVIK